MGFMKLRDEGVVAGCQSDLSATLTMMLIQQLFDRPGFQQNASMNTEQNRYFGAHCTSPAKMHGADAPPEPYILRNHAEAGWGCVPRVLFRPGQDVTLAQYVPGKSQPEMYVYSGQVVGCPDIPPAGGCRTNVEMTINEVSDVCDVKGMHQIIFYGNQARRLRTFCQLFGIPAVAVVRMMDCLKGKPRGWIARATNAVDPISQIRMRSVEPQGLESTRETATRARGRSFRLGGR